MEVFDSWGRRAGGRGTEIISFGVPQEGEVTGWRGEERTDRRRGQVRGKDPDEDNGWVDGWRGEGAGSGMWG